MHVFQFPPDQTKDYFVLKDGQSCAFGCNMATVGSSSSMKTFSLHGSASHPVKVTVKASNFLNKNANDSTWLLAQSVQTFMLNPGENYFLQDEWKDTTQFVAFIFEPLSAEDTACSLKFCLGARGFFRLKSDATQPELPIQPEPPVPPTSPEPEPTPEPPLPPAPPEPDPQPELPQPDPDPNPEPEIPEPPIPPIEPEEPPVPPVKPAQTTTDVTQNGEVIISKKDLINAGKEVVDNKESGVPEGTKTPVKIEITEVTGGTVKETDTSVIFVPDVEAGEDAGFKYDLIDDEGNKVPVPGIVEITVTMLPEVTGYIFPGGELETFVNNYKPPSFADIFNSWSRFYYKYYYPSGTAPQGEAASWEMNGTDRFRCTVNSNYLTGFVSPETFVNYEHQVDVSSTVSWDDDVIAIIIAFARINNQNHSLLVVREPGGIPDWTSNKQLAITYVVDHDATVIKAASGNNCFNGCPSSNHISGAYHWSRQSPSRIKIKRTGDAIKVWSSPWKSLDMAAGEYIGIDLANYPQLAWAREKLPYGYACYSTQHSSFSNVIFTGAGALDASMVYNLDTCDCLEFINGVWTPTGKKIWDQLGYPRTIFNPANNKRYRIENGSVTEITTES